MDIRNWPLDRIMQLPDCAFGRRWPIGLQAVTTSADPKFDISEAGLPEKTVIWEIIARNLTLLASSLEFTLAIGDQLPVTNAAFDEFELVFSGLHSRRGNRGGFEVLARSCVHLVKLRIPLATAGRRFVCRFLRALAESTGGELIIVVSSIPTEVPDWMISGAGKSL